MQKLLLMSTILVGLFSCRSSQDLIYLKDAAHNGVYESTPATENDHILKAGDILYISIKSTNPDVNQLFNPESNMENTTGNGYMKYTTPSGAYLYGNEIDPEGNVTLPILGKVRVAEVPTSKVEALIQEKADEYLKNAIVKVKLLNFKVTVMGEVRNPGNYYNYNNSFTVLEAIALANGNTDYASIKNVMVVRSTEKGNKTYMLDLSSKNVYTSEAYFLQPNDYVLVQPDRYKNFQLNSQAYSMLLSSVSLMIAVLGFALKL